MLYDRVKKSNTLLYWTLNQAESSWNNAIDTASPAVFLLHGPLTAIDKMVCRSLDIVEERVPQINLPPQMIYFNTKQYVSDVGTKIVKPVLKRADSVKQIGNSVLASKYTAFAAGKLDGALDIADKYVDKYLPADVFDSPANDERNLSRPIDGPGGKSLQTIQHVDRFSRKLTRRLTRRTLAEAKALKDQGTEAIHVLIYVAELIAKDPKLAFQKGRELWAALSKDEPENQARPDSLEQLIVMLTRESARRIVHFVNFTSVGIKNLPHHLSTTITYASQKCVHVLDALLKTIHLEGVRQTITSGAQVRTQRFTSMLKLLNTYATDILEYLAHFLAAQKEHSISQINQESHKTTPTPSTVNQNYQKQGNPVDSLVPPTAQKMSLKATRKHVNNTTASTNVSNGIDFTNS